MNKGEECPLWYISVYIPCVWHTNCERFLDWCSVAPSHHTRSQSLNRAHAWSHGGYASGNTQLGSVCPWFTAALTPLSPNIRGLVEKWILSEVCCPWLSMHQLLTDKYAQSRDNVTAMSWCAYRLLLPKLDLGENSKDATESWWVDRFLRLLLCVASHKMELI